MRAVRYYGQKDIRVEEIEAPSAGPGEVLIDIAWCGICGTDLHEYLEGPIFIPAKGHPHPVTGEEMPITLGHEFSCLLYTSPSPRDLSTSRMPSSA